MRLLGILLVLAALASGLAGCGSGAADATAELRARLAASEEAIADLGVRLDAMQTSTTTATEPTTTTVAGPAPLSESAITELVADKYGTTTDRVQITDYKTVNDSGAYVVVVDLVSVSDDPAVGFLEWKDQSWTDTGMGFLPYYMDPVETEHQLIGEGYPRDLVDWLCWVVLWPPDQGV